MIVTCVYVVLLAISFGNTLFLDSTASEMVVCRVVGRECGRNDLVVGLSYAVSILGMIAMGVFFALPGFYRKSTRVKDVVNIVVAICVAYMYTKMECVSPRFLFACMKMAVAPAFQVYAQWPVNTIHVFTLMGVMAFFVRMSEEMEAAHLRECNTEMHTATYVLSLILLVINFGSHFLLAVQ